MNVLSSTIVLTRNDPLYPLSNTPVAVPLLSVTFLTNILSPGFKWCGTSATTVTAVPDTEHVLINLGLRLKS